MAVVFVEARPKGKSNDGPVTDYVVKDHADHVLAKSRITRRTSRAFAI